MPEINTKFLANPGWGIEEAGGQVLTINIHNDTARKQWATVNFNQMITEALKMKLGMKVKIPEIESVNRAAIPVATNEIAVGTAKVTTDAREIDVTNNFVNSQWYQEVYGIDSICPAVGFRQDGLTLEESGVLFFIDFIQHNPIQVVKLNFRASDAVALPSTITVLTPNIFTGQFNRQIINVTADSNMYQNQANIITMKSDFFLNRNCMLEFSSPALQPNATLSVDVTFNRYLSLEKALEENAKLLNTQSGINDAVVKTINDVNARIEPASATPGVAPINLNPDISKVNLSRIKRLNQGPIRPSIRRW